MKRNYKKLAVLVAVLMITLSIASTGFAADTVANLKAYYRNIKMYRNGTQVQISAEPFIVDGTTYLPVRAISELLDKDVTWNQATYSIGINDKAGTADVNALLQQVVTQQQTILQLQAKVKSLETQVATKVMDIDDMEEYLNDEYGYSNKIQYDIDLSGTKDKMQVRIYVDLYDYSTKWSALTSTQKKTYLQNIVDDILEEYEDATITGFIEDTDEDVKLLSFTVSTKGIVTVGGTTSGSTTLSSLEDYLNDEFGRYNSVDFEYELSGDKYEIDLAIYVDEDDWEDFSTTAKKTFLKKIGQEINYDFPNADVYGEVLDDYYEDELNYFEYIDGSLYLE